MDVQGTSLNSPPASASSTNQKDGMQVLPSVGADAAQQLQSPEQAELLDAIDRLRRENIDADISIPQIVVCGDQSSGKSSLLEAIAQVPFPAGSGTTTLFAIEVVLRNAAKLDIRVSIEPASDRTEEAKKHLRNFRPNIAAFEPNSFLTLHESASRYLKEYEPDRGFWYDRLRAEISGPDQPHLTLIDLPGLIADHDENLGQQLSDIDNIRNVVKAYLANPRTVVLAVFSAATDLQNQSIANLLRGSEVSRSRTLGVITKPDRAGGVDDIEKMIAMARNENISLGLGWHAAKNLGPEEPDRSQTYRDAEERKFFQSTTWSKLPADDLGIVRLRHKLGQALMNCIKQDLPNLVSEMEEKLGQTKRILEQLGQARDTPKDHRIYLTSIAIKLRELIKCALDGDNIDADGSGFFDHVRGTKLRSVVSKRSDEYASVMRSRGHQFFVEQDVSAGVKDIPILPESYKLNFSPPYTSAHNPQGLHQWRIPFERYCNELAGWMLDNRGKDLRGLIKRGSIQAVFRQQSVYWDLITRAHVAACHSNALESVRLAVMHVAGRHTGQKLMQAYITPAFDTKYQELEAKVTELLWPYRKCHLMTDNPRWVTRTKQDKSEDATQNGPLTDWTTRARECQLSTEAIIAAKAIEQAEVFYDIALDTVIDNVASLAVEKCLLDDLPDLIALDDVAGLDDDQLGAIGCEPLQARGERCCAKAQASALEEVIRTCRRHANHQSSRQVTGPQPEMQDPALDETFGRLSVHSSSEKPRRIHRKRQEVQGSAVVHGLATPEASPGNKGIPAIYSPEPEPLRRASPGGSLFPGVSVNTRRSGNAPQWKYREPVSDEEL